MTPVLKLGAKGPDVQALQAKLISIGEKLDTDGDFGPATEAAVKRFQASVNLVPDGEVGEKTQAALSVAVPLVKQPSIVIPVVSGIGEKIVSEARKYINLTEIRNNSAWDNTATLGKDVVADELVQKLTEAGWQKGWAYCIAWCEVVLRGAYKDSPEKLSKIASLLNPSVMSSYNNCKAAGLIKQTPVPGAVFFMQKGSTGLGHAGVVERIISSARFGTIEANTSPNPTSTSADRDGDGIYDKSRSLNFTHSSGLHLVGFLHPL